MKVQGEKDTGPGGIYYVDVIVRKATLLEELVSGLRPDGADLVPEEALVPPGSNFGERRRQNRPPDGPLGGGRRSRRAA